MQPLALLAPLVMVTVELVMPQIFPYYLGLSQAFVPVLIQIADLTGPLGVTALMLTVSGAVADWTIRSVRLRARAARAPPGAGWRSLACCIVADLGYGALRMHQADARRAAAPKVKTGIVQANVGILEKWDPLEFARLLTHAPARLRRARARGRRARSSGPSRRTRTRCRGRSARLRREDARMRRVRRGFDTPLLFGAVTRSVGPTARRGPIATPTTPRS